MAIDYKGLSSIIAFRFYKDVGAYADPAVVIDLDPDGTGLQCEMPFAGCIVAMWADHSAATSSTHTVAPTIDGTEDSDGNITLAIGAGADDYATYMPGAIPFTKGQTVGVSILGTTGEDAGNVSATLFVQIGESQT